MDRCENGQENGGRTLEVVDFRCVELDENTQELVVSGEVPYGGGEVFLEPRIYVAQPDYWGVEVIWDRTGAMLTVITPYEARIPLGQVGGKKGIRLYGKTRTLTIERPAAGE